MRINKKLREAMRAAGWCTASDIAKYYGVNTGGSFYRALEDAGIRSLEVKSGEHDGIMHFYSWADRDRYKAITRGSRYPAPATTKIDGYVWVMPPEEYQAQEITDLKRLVGTLIDRLDQLESYFNSNL